MDFVDTNVLVYAITPAPDEADKREVAQQILGRRDLALSVQVLQEFYTQVTRPGRPGRISHPVAAELVRTFLRFEVQVIDTVILERAMETATRFGISYWDAAIVEAAKRLGCQRILSEDLNEGQDYGGVLVSNPFPAG